MPQVSFTVTDDTNFTGPVRIRGVKLEDLARALGSNSTSDMVIAICDDGYQRPIRAPTLRRIIPCWCSK